MEQKLILVVLIFAGSLSLAKGSHHDYGYDDYDYQPRRASPFALEAGGKGHYKGSGDVRGEADLLGQRGGFRGETNQEGFGEGGARWDRREIGGGVRGGSKGSSKGAVMGDTWIGGGSASASGAHDVGGEGGISWNNGRDYPDRGYPGRDYPKRPPRPTRPSFPRFGTDNYDD